MGNILANFALQYGRQIEYGQQQEQIKSEQEARSALAQLRTQEVADSKAKAAEQQRIQGMRQQMGAKIAAAQAADANDVKSLQSNANMLAKYAVQLDAEGDFEGGKKLMEESKSLVGQAKTLQETQLKESAANQEAMAGAAMDAQAAPTPENLKSLAQAAVKAGINPLDIPNPGTPEMQTFITKLANQGRTVKERVELASKEQERKAQLEQRKEEMRMRHEEAEARRRDAAAAREQSLELRKAMVSIAAARETRQAGSATDGGALSKPMQDSIQKVNQAAPQLAQQFELLGAMSPGVTLAAFSQLKPGGTVTEALAKAGTTHLSTQEQQLMAATAKGAGIVMGRLIQATEGGRALTQSQQDTLETALTPSAGETSLSAAFKHARMSEEVTSMLEHLPLERMPEWQRKQVEQTRDRFKVPIGSMEILKIAQKSKNPQLLQQVMTASTSVEKAMSVLQSGAGAAAPSTPPLPSGWSVNVK